MKSLSESDYYQKQILLKISYDGRKFSGMAFNNDHTDTIEKRLLLSLKKIRLIPEDATLFSINFSRCGRTDAGVSAAGNYVSLAIFCKEKNDEKEINYADRINSQLPWSIRIVKWAPVPLNFNARFSCIRRIYYYSFFKKDFDLGLMSEGCKKLIGKHDFRNFCKMDVRNCRKFVREIFSCRIVQGSLPQMGEIEIIASGFLQRQVRHTATILFLIGKRLEEPSIIDFLLDLGKCTSKPNFLCAPPEPLRMQDCVFKQQELLKFKSGESSKWYEAEQVAQKTRRDLITHLNFLNNLTEIDFEPIEDQIDVFGQEYNFLGNRKTYVEVRKLPRNSTFEEKLKFLKMKE